MSEMEMYIGTAKRYVGPDIEVKDEDDFYDLEEELGLTIVKVNDELWCIEQLQEVDAYGFQTILEPQEHPIFIGYWYNGGAGLHEVAESAIKNWLEAKENGDQGSEVVHGPDLDSWKS